MPARNATKEWEKNGRAALEAARKAVNAGNSADAERVHGQLMKVERELLDEDGLAGRPWFKHLIYAPRPTYKAIVLPALTEAIEARDQARAKVEVERLTRALNRAATALGSGN
jgi:N-acetylated-alpha-linked acidic dipeptidase